MLPGPVFNVELLTSSRRRWTFGVRVVYGLILLFVIWMSYRESFPVRAMAAGTVSTQRLSQFAMQIFAVFAITQAVAVALLTPPLIAGVIADDRQRKTLHYLLASRLTAGEIVLGKLAAKLLHLGAFLAIGLPILSLLTLFGGIDPRLVALSYLGTVSTSLFLASLAVAVSAVSKKVRDAIVGTYLLGLIWAFSPLLIEGVFKYTAPAFYAAIRPVNDWLLATTPFYLVFAGSPAGVWSAFAWMVGLQLGIAALLIGLATVTLRPAFRSEGGLRRRRRPREAKAEGPPRKRREPRRLFPRPPIGGDPMYWKERYGGRVSRATRVAAVLVVLGVVSGVGYCLYELAEPAFSELLAEGYGASGMFNDRRVLAGTARVVGAFLYALMALGVGVAAASSVAGEREQDTWTSLLTTDLTGGEILRAKLFGAVWSGRWIFAPAALLWLVATAAGGMHPYGLLMELVATAIFTWFAAALGIWFSLTRRNSTRALCWTIGTMLFLNAGYLLLLAWFFNDGWIIAGSTPYIVGLVGVSVEEVWTISGFLDQRWFSPLTTDEGPDLIAGCIIGLFGYGIAAAGLTAYCVRSFDRIVDRPSASVGPSGASSRARRPGERAGRLGAAEEEAGERAGR